MLARILLISALVCSIHCLIQCPPNYCARVNCNDGLTAELCESKGAKLRKQGTFCGCCDTCIKQLQEGENCRFTFLLGVPSTSECAEGLRCDFKTFRCTKAAPEPAPVKADGPCTQKADEMRKLNDAAKKSTGHELLGWSLPKCDSEGNYEGKQCRGSQCFCVDKAGSEITGYSHNRWESRDDITCGCARKKDGIKQSGLIGVMTICDEFGDFSSMQCMGSVCFCADKMTGKKVGTSTVKISEMDSLNC